LSAPGLALLDVDAEKVYSEQDAAEILSGNKILPTSRVIKIRNHVLNVLTSSQLLIAIAGINSETLLDNSAMAEPYHLAMYKIMVLYFDFLVKNNKLLHMI
jgi:hypothetical protein